MNFENHKYPHKLIFNQSNDILKSIYTDCVNILPVQNNLNNNKWHNFRLNLKQYGKQPILGCKNLVLVINLDSDEQIKYLLLIELIDKIIFQINGRDMEDLNMTNLIWIMINYYKLEIKQIGSKIYFPIPLSLFQNGFIPYYFNSFSLLLKFNTLNQIYNKIIKLNILVDIFYGKLDFNEEYLLNYKNNYLPKLEYPIDKIKNINNLNNFALQNYENISIVNLKKIIDSNNFVLWGYIYSESINFSALITNTHIWTTIPRNSNFLS